MLSNEIRQRFLDFFAAKNHKIVSSSPIVIKNDPTLLFTNAGMNQFKDYFLGNSQAENRRVADSQKCLRASGKHNDLEDVGKDTYHHTMFEMLGNWSFGDYFKKEAIDWSWELLTEVFDLDKDRLYVTIFEGDEEVSIDDEAIGFWGKHVAADRILRGNKKDNFWEMGETGPCGPCSEIHYDARPDSERKMQNGAELVNQDHPQVIEIWNLVFMQFNRMKDGSLQSLKEKHIDTGMGLERLALIVQNKKSNYDTDVFSYLIKACEERFKVSYGTNTENDIALRVIADHIRAICFTIGDGQLPSNNGAGYVVRRILRRAVRYAFKQFNSSTPFLHELSHLVANHFKTAYPELKEQEDFIANVIREEENAFLRTLATGTKKFEKYIESAKNKSIDGDFAFELYDTSGFPIDLTTLMAEEVGFEVDVKGFEKALAQQKNRSKADAVKDQGDWTILKEGEVDFVGYDVLESKAEVLRHRSIKAKGKTIHQIVLNKTPFYPEGGGQVGDTGYLQFGEEKISVFDTKKENELIIHFVKQLPADLDKEARAVVHKEKRQNTERNHSVTHLVHSALRQVLGDHVAQKGSLVGPEYMRFDFSHFSKMTDEELTEVEEIVNEKIRENIELKEDRKIAIDQAKEAGAMMLFGEKYGDEVRMITFDPSYSIELCGGTHVNATGEIGYCKIVGETGVSAGVRRVEVLTGAYAEKQLREESKMLSLIKELLKAKNPLQSVEKLVQDKKELEHQIEKFKEARAANMKTELMGAAEKHGDINLIVKQVELDDPGQGKNLAFAIRSNAENTIAVLGSAIKGKANLWIVISENLVDELGLNAKEIIKVISPEIKGGGGGQAFFASAGGKNTNGLKAALDKAKIHIMTAIDENK